MKKISVILLCVFLISSCASFPGSALLATPTETATLVPPTETPIPFAISVNGLTITKGEYSGEIERFQASQTKLGGSKTAEEVAKLVQEELVSQLLLAQGASEAGFVLTDADLQKKIDALTAELGSKEKVEEWITNNFYTDETFREALRRNTAVAWMRNSIASQTPITAEQVHIRQLLLYDEPTAQYYLSQLQAGIDFDVLATQIEPVTRGDIGWFPKGYIPDPVVEEAAFGLEVGQTSPIITGNSGFYILKCLDKQPTRELSPDVLSVMQKLAIADWINTQRSAANIQINP